MVIRTTIHISLCASLCAMIMLLLGGVKRELDEFSPKVREGLPMVVERWLRFGKGRDQWRFGLD